MADRKISELTALTAPASGDYLPIVDVSEAAAADKNKRITVSELLRGAPNGSAAAPGFAFESDDDNGMFLSGTNAVGFSTAGSQRVTIDGGGRLLVNASSSTTIGSYTTSLLQVRQGNSSTQAGLSITADGSSGTTFPRLLLSRSNAGATAVVNGSTLGFIQYAGLDSSGNYIPAAWIESAVDGTPGSNDMPGRLVFSTTADGASSPTERVRIDSSGRILLTCGATGTGLAIDHAGAAGSSVRLIRGNYSGGTESFRVLTNGNVENTNNSYGAISDIKLKENILDANSQWDDIKALRPVKYNFKEGQTHTQLGLIAQEVELVSPGLVSESPDLDEEGNDLGTVTKSVNYSVLYMKAVKALQEAMERIETLEAKVAALESA